MAIFAWHYSCMALDLARADLARRARKLQALPVRGSIFSFTGAHFFPLHALSKVRRRFS
jgi:hypothetical protein